MEKDLTEMHEASWQKSKAGNYTAKKYGSWRKELETYSVQMDVNLTASIDGGLLAPELCDFAQDADCAVGELL